MRAGLGSKDLSQNRKASEHAELSIGLQSHRGTRTYTRVLSVVIPLQDMLQGHAQSCFLWSLILLEAVLTSEPFYVPLSKTFNYKKEWLQGHWRSR